MRDKDVPTDAQAAHKTKHQEPTAALVITGGANPPETCLPGEFFDPLRIDYDELGPVEFEHLGKLLVYLRLTYPERLAGGSLQSAPLSLPANGIAKYLKQRNYSMTSGSYSLLEQGKTLPGSPATFFRLLCDCLSIQPSSKYRPLLLFQYLYDAAVRSVGKALADKYVPHGELALADLRNQIESLESTAAEPV